MKLKYLICGLILGPSMVFAQDSINERLAKNFDYGLSVSRFVRHSNQELKKITEISLGDEKKFNEDRIFCFTPKSKLQSIDYHLRVLTSFSAIDYNAKKEYPKGRLPFNDWPATYFENSSNERCNKFKIDSYNHEPAMMAFLYKGKLSPVELASGYSPNLPYLRAKYIAEKSFQTYFLPELTSVFNTAANKLTEIAIDKNVSPTERSLAVATKKILLKKADIKKIAPAEIASSSFEVDYLQDYENSMKYLAFVALDTLNNYDWDLSLYHDFSLDLDIQDLNKKVEKATAAAEEALMRAQIIENKLSHEQKTAMIRSAIFWSAAGIYLKTMLPR